MPGMQAAAASPLPGEPDVDAECDLQREDDRANDDGQKYSRIAQVVIPAIGRAAVGFSGHGSNNFPRMASPGILVRIMPDAEPNMRELKSRAQLLKPAIRLGKAGLTPEFLAAFDETLQRAGLVKLRFEDFKDERKALSKQLAGQSGSRLVLQVGYTAVFYRAKCAPAAKPESAAPGEI